MNKYWIVVCIFVVVSCANIQRTVESDSSETKTNFVDHPLYLSQPTLGSDGQGGAIGLELQDGIQRADVQEDISYLQIVLGNELQLRRQPYEIDFSDCEYLARKKRNASLANYCLKQAAVLYDLASEGKLARLLVELQPYNPNSYLLLAESLVRAQEYAEALDVLMLSNELGATHDLAMPAERAAFLYGDDILDLIAHYSAYIAQKPEKRSLYVGVASLLTRRMEQSYLIGSYQQVLDTIDQIFALSKQGIFEDGSQATELNLGRVYITKALSLNQLGRVEEAILGLEELASSKPDFALSQVDLIRLKLYLIAKRYQPASRLAIAMIDSYRQDENLLLNIGILVETTPLVEVRSAVRQHFLDISGIEDIQKTEISLYSLSKLEAAAGNTAARMEYLAAIRKTDSLVVLSVGEQAKIIGEQHGKQAARDFYRVKQLSYPALASQMQLSEAYWLSGIDRNEAVDYVTDLLKLGGSNNHDLLYVRGFFYAIDGNLPAMENDFLKILAANPLHIDALNAYGYTLVDTTDRIEEGLAFISRAFALDELQRPAIVDSLAWAYFRSGDNRRALVLIQQAYSKSRDPEIAAHYGEILWTLGYTEEARALLDRDRKKHLDNKVLQSTWLRLFGN